MSDIWNSVLTAMKDIAITGVAGLILTSVLGIVVGWIKKGKLESFGQKCGAAVSKFARAKVGAKFWERVEDVVTLSVLSFVKGFKVGSDMDDTLPDDTHIDAGKVLKTDASVDAAADANADTSADETTTP